MAVYIKQSPPREGVRGGWEDFNWDMVKNQPGGDRDHYLGASVKVGLHSHGGKLEKHDWWTKKKTREPTGEAAVTELEELRKFESQLMDEALGLRPRQLLAGGSLKDGVSVAEGQDLLQDKCTVPKAEGLTKKELKRLEKKQRKLVKRKRKEEKRARRRLKKVKREEGESSVLPENGRGVEDRRNRVSYDTNSIASSSTDRSRSGSRRRVRVRSSVKTESSTARPDSHSRSRTRSIEGALRSKGKVCHRSPDSESRKMRNTEWYGSRRQTASCTRYGSPRERCKDFSDRATNDQYTKRRTHRDSEVEHHRRIIHSGSPKRLRRHRSASSESYGNRTRRSITKDSPRSDRAAEGRFRERARSIKGGDALEPRNKSAESKQQLGERACVGRHTSSKGLR